MHPPPSPDQVPLVWGRHKETAAQLKPSSKSIQVFICVRETLAGEIFPGVKLELRIESGSMSQLSHFGSVLNS